MEIIRAEESHEIQSAVSCTATEYPTTSPSLNIARIQINGRFPESGVMWNTEVEEIVYVESGEGSVCVDGVTQNIKQGDVLLYRQNEKVFWEGELTLITASTPAWTVGQHVVEE